MLRACVCVKWMGLSGGGGNFPLKNPTGTSLQCPCANPSSLMFNHSLCLLGKARQTREKKTRTEEHPAQKKGAAQKKTRCFYNWGERGGEISRACYARKLSVRTPRSLHPRGRTGSRRRQAGRRGGCWTARRSSRPPPATSATAAWPGSPAADPADGLLGRTREREESGIELHWRVTIQCMGRRATPQPQPPPRRHTPAP